MSNLIFFGINGVGLGHIARLSVIQRHLTQSQPEITIEALCRSQKGACFFPVPAKQLEIDDAI